MYALIIVAVMSAYDAPPSDPGGLRVINIGSYIHRSNCERAAENKIDLRLLIASKGFRSNLDPASTHIRCIVGPTYSPEGRPRG